ncbi:MAG: hypothetical protein ACOY99_01300 [Pseudomonadota bacterium]
MAHKLFAAQATAFLLSAALGPALAQEQATSWTCTNGGMTRSVELRENIPTAPLCEVWYDKTAEGGAKARLWSADNDGAYCRGQAEGFVAKLEGWGWQCSLAAAAPVEEEPAPEASPPN